MNEYIYRPTPDGTIVVYRNGSELFRLRGEGLLWQSGTEYCRGTGSESTPNSDMLPDSGILPDRDIRPESRRYIYNSVEISAVPEPENMLTLRFTSDPDAELGELACPYQVEPRADDILLIPHCEGFALPADSDVAGFPERLYAAGGGGLSMAYYGILRGGSWLLVAIITNRDAQLSIERSNKLLAPRVIWLAQKGRGGYARELRLVCGDGGISELCAAYRLIAAEKGLIKPFSERINENPLLGRLVGAANVWLWNDDAMDKLYAERAQNTFPTSAQIERRLDVARDMLASGMERLLWSLFDEHTDAYEVDKIKRLGYLTSYYDIYTDVIPHDIAHLIPPTRVDRCQPRYDLWPDGVAVSRDGSLQKAWQLKGTDGRFYYQNRICDACALDCAAREAPAHRERTHIDGRFIDVSWVTSNECWSDRHPLTRSDAIEYKRRMLQMLREHNMVVGTEIGCEDGADLFDYSEGMLSPPFCRQYDAGRRMCSLYYNDEIEPRIHSVMLNPKLRAPLWELCYHGCVQSYWYWGDSSCCMPELTRLRDIFCRLYGQPGLYSFRVSDWPRLKPYILASYRATVPAATAVGFAQMERFDVLDSERLIQRTRFSNGVEVVANFNQASAFYYRGREIAPMSSELIFPE